MKALVLALIGLLPASLIAQNSCLPAIDTDSDRLRDCFETQIGTNLSAADTDGDSLGDGDEVLGTLGGLNLPAFGVNPTRKDILMEVDFVYDPVVAESPLKRSPKPDFVQTVQEVFRRLPFFDNDGYQAGVNVVFADGNAVSLPGGFWANPEFWSNLQAIKSANFDSNRRGYFRYALAVNGGAGALWNGMAEILGDDMFFNYYAAEGHPTLPQSLLEKQSADLFAHELGHLLGLQHGGGDSCNYKPNYPSLMNYRYKGGIDTRFLNACVYHKFAGATDDNFRIQFSFGVNSPLDENQINERSGFCATGSQYYDFNSNGLISAVPYQMNITSECEDVPLRVMYDYPDHVLMNFSGIVPNKSPATVITD